MSIAVLVMVAVLFLIVFGTVCFTIFHLKMTPVRIATVILAMGTLIGAMVPVVRLLTEPQSPTVAVAAAMATVSPRPTEEGI
ncbi:hypothetical protein [Streptomyces sp. NBC_01022]|uniref:hypothetical protein n=1 Tax=Streptomyces sp. NBC_01022 TaxID=2903723 RepID=UPI002DD83265|nr:hypothetical protein [Streptomyces sp. NBC_01022]WRZ87444.1 hypothetical protein OG316_44900 [Streptomyces sp. NBC_01022]